MKRKVLSLILAALLVLSSLPSSASAEEILERIPADSLPAEAFLPETTEAALPTEAAVSPTADTTEPQAPETSPATEETVPGIPEETVTATTEVTIPEVTEKTVPETRPEETLACGLAGLPADYILSSQELADKQQMVQHQVAQQTAALEEGTQYEPGVLLAWAADAETAALYADAFCARLQSWCDGLAILKLDGLTVVEALTAAQSEDRLPAVYPNHTVTLSPEIEEAPGNALRIQSAAEQVPQPQSWSAWRESTENPDPYLKDPTADSYQYMHDPVDTYAAWGVTTGKGVTVAVLDTGVAEHPDLPNVERVSVNGLGVEDIQGHGTHVAGIIAAAMGNGIGGAGIAPDARILSLRVMTNSGAIYDSTLIAGLQAAVKNGADIANISLGGLGYNATLQKAIDQAAAQGLTIVAAMGNDGTNCLNYPAGYDNVIAVVATDRTNTRHSGSSYGTWADVAAPGKDIMSTLYTGGYGTKTGTSMAAPVVAGVAALYQSIHPAATPSQITARLKATATKGGSDLGAGIVNAAKMLSEKPGTPTAALRDGESDALLALSTGKTLTAPWDSVLTLTGNGDTSDYILYTLDGTTPGIRSGQVTRGQRYTAPISLAAYSGQTLTVKAMQVNGLGMAGSVVTCRIQVSKGTDSERVTVTGPTRLLAGKTGEFRAAVFAYDPAEPVDQRVTWRILDASENLSKAKINPTTGKLTTPKLSAGDSGWVEVQAVAAAGGIASQPFRVCVEQLNPVAKMTLSSGKVSCYTAQTFLLTVKMLDGKGNEISPEVSWSSSNTKVAAVENGRVYALSKGSAAITCKALDGSGKSVKCTVSVQQSVESLTITGQASVAPGSSAVFRASPSPANAVNRFTWSVASGPAGTRMVGSRLYIPADAAPGETVVIAARPPEGAGSGAEYQVTIAPKCAAVRLEIAGDYGYVPVSQTRDRSGKLTRLTLYSVQPAQTLPGYHGRQDSVRLIADPVDRTGVYLGNTGCIRWSSSNASVASVDDTGLVQVHRAGTAKITAAAMDGSGKKQSVTVSVTNPVSTISLSSSAPKSRMQLAQNLLAAGKSVTHKVQFAETYGKPANRRLAWYWQAADSRGNDCTALLVPYISLSSGGKLSISGRALETIRSYVQAENPLKLTVTAQSQDLSGAEASFTYCLVPPAAKLYVERSFSTLGNYPGKTREVKFYCDQFRQGRVSNFVITSSNPAVASVSSGSTAVGVSANPSSPGQDGWYSLLIYSTQPGTAKITVKTTDGTNKSCTITVRCYKDP